jgi:hypothetical protein
MSPSDVELNGLGAALAAKVFDAFDVDRRGVIRVETDAMKHVAASSKYELHIAASNFSYS